MADNKQQTKTAQTAPAGQKPPTPKTQQDQQQLANRVPPDNKYTMIQTFDSARAILDKLVPYFKRTLPSHVNAERLAEVAFFSVRQNPKLLNCTKSSFGAALMQCGKLGLYPDVRGHAYLIPRATLKIPGSKDKMDEVHFQPGYQGLLDLARRSGEIEQIEAMVVYEGDKFEYEYGTEKFLRHKPQEGTPKDNDKIRYAYAIAWLKGARAPQFVVIDRVDVARIKESNISPTVTPKEAAYYSPWHQHRGAMWMKTAAKRLAKWLPASIDLQEAVAFDDQSDAGKSQNLPAPPVDDDDDTLKLPLSLNDFGDGDGDGDGGDNGSIDGEGNSSAER